MAYIDRVRSGCIETVSRKGWNVKMVMCVCVLFLAFLPRNIVMAAHCFLALDSIFFKVYERHRYSFSTALCDLSRLFAVQKVASLHMTRSHPVP